MRKKTIYLCVAAAVAALYAVLTYLSAMLGMSSGVIQLRLSELLCVLPYFTSAAIPGLTVGCFIANLLTGNIFDIIFGTLATAIGAFGTYLIGKTRAKWAAPIPPIVANTLIIPFVIVYSYGAEEGIGFIMLTLLIGETVSVGLLGGALIPILDKYKQKLFK